MQKEKRVKTDISKPQKSPTSLWSDWEFEKDYVVDEPRGIILNSLGISMCFDVRQPGFAIFLITASLLKKCRSILVLQRFFNLEATNNKVMICYFKMTPLPILWHSLTFIQVTWWIVFETFCDTNNKKNKMIWSV